MMDVENVESMFYFPNTRKPDFKKACGVLDKQSQNIYQDYWQDKSIALRDKLMEREVIFFNWIKPNSKVLNIGCGNSRLLLELKNKKQCQIFGIDIEESVIQLLKNNNIDGLVADISQANFDLKNLFNFKFDYIIISEVLEHLALPENLIQKTKQHTQYLIISVPNSAFYRYRLGLMFKGRFFTQWAKHPAEHLRYWSYIDFVDWLSAMDLKILKCKSSNGLSIGPVKLFNFWKNLLGHQICYFCEKLK